MEYYPIQKKWSKIKAAINTESVQAVMVRDMNKFTYGRWHTPFKAGMKPTEVESCDWRWSEPRRGRHPEFWDYVKHAAAPWVVNFNLKIAEIVEPARKWRIITSEEHSTVWDGQNTLFDMNFLALGVDVNEAWELANKTDSFMLMPGEELELEYAEWCKLQHTPPEKVILN